jgi:LDH2 family malate/lactate/ureidoglycolate dehydrogenase
MPGERALQRRAEQLEHGVALQAGIMQGIRPWSEKLGVAEPSPRA